jgi:ribosomal protein L37AE/L43A
MKQHVRPRCKQCNETYGIKRFKAGYKLCLHCGEQAATQDRKLWCIAPLHKSNYVLITSKPDLQGLNNKGGLVK